VTPTAHHVACLDAVAAGAPQLLQLAGFKDTIEEGFLILPESAALPAVQKLVDSLAAQAVKRAAEEDKKRKLELEKAAKAREARAQKARDEAEPAAYDATVAKSSQLMADEDETMVAAIEEHMDSHPELKAGRPLDSYAIERQVAGPGGSVVASIAASAGMDYYDYVVHMKRSGGGEWSVTKVESA